MLNSTVDQTSTTFWQKWRQSVVRCPRPRPKEPWCESWRDRDRSKMGSTRMLLQGCPQVLRKSAIQSRYLETQADKNNMQALPLHAASLLALC